jgi:hypothetical protein
MKRYLIAALCALAVGQVSAQDLKMRDVFKQIPDSLVPYLSQNNRLDFIDFLDSNMKAEVRNKLGGMSEMTALTDDSLSIRMSNALQVDMLLLKLDQPVDSIQQVVVFSQAFLTDSVYRDTKVLFYTPDWKLLTKEIPLNDIQRQRIKALELKNILKWNDDKLNKS